MTLTPANSHSAAPTGAAGGDFTGTYPDPTVAAAKITAAKMASGAAADGTVATADGAGAVSYLAVLRATLAYLTVQTGVPGAFSRPLVYDNTAVTGGLYAWNGAAYSKVGGLAS